MLAGPLASVANIYGNELIDGAQRPVDTVLGLISARYGYKIASALAQKLFARGWENTNLVNKAVDLVSFGVWGKAVELGLTVPAGVLGGLGAYTLGKTSGRDILAGGADMLSSLYANSSFSRSAPVAPVGEIKPPVKSSGLYDRVASQGLKRAPKGRRLELKKRPISIPTHETTPLDNIS